MLCLVKFSLVSAPVLGLDLVRHPQGDAVAAVLLRALSCGPDDLAVFAEAHSRVDEDRRAASWAVIRRKAHLRRGEVRGASRRVPAELAEMVIDLREPMLIGLDDLAALIDTDVLAWTARPETGEQVTTLGAGGPFVDAIASLWPGDLASADRRELADPFVQASRRIGRLEPDLGPQAVEIRDVLRQLGCLCPEERVRLRLASAELGRIAGEWSHAMHEASWAALTTGRIRVAAAAQLLTVQAFSSSGFDPDTRIDGLWNAVSGHIHATVVADVLQDDVRELLGSVWREAIEEHRRF